MNGIGRRIRSAWNGFITRRRLEALGEGAAADLGLTPADLREAAGHRGDVPERMQRMAALFGAGPALAGVGRHQMLDMARACTCCTGRAECAHLLYGPAAASAADAGFCPNAADYRALAAAAPAPRR